MDKKKIMNVALALLPLAAVVLAGMPNGVTVFSKEVTAPVTCSMFTLIEDVQWAVCLPFAGVLGAVTFGLGVIHLVKQKALWLKLIFGSTFAATTLSVLPLMVQKDTILVPNMLIPILLGVEALLAYGLIRKPVQEEEKKKGVRLKAR